MLQEIHSDDRESDSCQQKLPLEAVAIEGEGNVMLFLA
jgi:hypothetical protein